MPGRSWQVELGNVGDLGTARGSITIIRRPGAFLISLTAFRAAWKPCAIQGLQPSTIKQVGVLDVLGGVAELIAVEAPVHPEVAGLLLRERVEVLGRAERAAERREVRAAEMVALPAPAIERERVRAVRRRSAFSLAAISANAVSHVIGSWVPSGRRRSGVVRRSAWSPYHWRRCAFWQR